MALVAGSGYERPRGDTRVLQPIVSREEPSRRSERRPARRVPRVALLLLGLSLAAVGGVAWLVRDPTARILERRGGIARVEIELVRAGEAYRDEELRLVSTSGLEVELAIRRPAGESARALPTALILGGNRTGRDAAWLVEAGRGTVVAALSYPTRVQRIEGPSDAFDVRRAILDTPAAVMLAMDHLVSLPEVDPARVELVGVSLGAPFACVVGALDHRFRRVWSIHGGGDPLRLFDHALAKDVGFAPARVVAAFSIALAAHGFELAPEAWAGRIAPTPFVMVNAEGDRRIPRTCVETLYAAAREPKELRWVEGAHVSGRDEEQVRALCALVLERMRADP